MTEAPAAPPSVGGAVPSACAGNRPLSHCNDAGPGACRGPASGHLPRCAARRGGASSFGNERAWLYGIARHRALRALRRGRRFQRALVRLGGSREIAQDADEDVVALLDLLERELSPELQALVLLRYVHGFQAAELAEMTGLTPDAVRQRLARGRARLLAVEPKEA